MSCIVLFQNCAKRKTPSPRFLPLSVELQARIFSTQKLSHTTNNNRLDKALRVLDIISPKENSSVSRQSHLRLVQEFLRTNSDQLNRQRVPDDFACSNSTKGVPDMLDGVVGSDFLNKENPVSVLLWLHSEGSRFDANALSRAVSSCGSVRSSCFGVQVHCLALRTGFVFNVYVGSALISLYCKCGKLEDAQRMFEEMPVRNIVSWTAIISGFAQEWQVDVCLELYHRMRNSTLKPNDFTFTSLLSACTGSGSLWQGKTAHCQTIQMGFDSYTHIANALISMYCKCGDVRHAFSIFEKLPCKDIVSWNSMIAGYALYGLAVQAIDLFEEMKKERVKPDAISFLGILSSCRHAGLVKQGRNYFNLMVEHGVEPELDHYSCIVDLLGRAGCLQESLDFIEKMPIYPNAITWGSLLSSSRLHGNVWIGIKAAESRLLLEPDCASTHVQLANLYASAGCWDQAARVRKMMKDKGLKTDPGYSWIEVKREIHRFRANDPSNYKMIEILTVLDGLLDHMRRLGFVPGIQGEGVGDDFYAVI
ncbi:pentatricopeptide repeat-containing protein At2g37320 [Malania oleifera]|uniref:pentatricopeptide repeat-containing protein At2g37320 n=1 Tax=Malania oleifera TaxID=397392 RepID=UPI0025AE202B|nr:pentatricopeptide repeat-containing protein At2g37320 [Malania oleifera]